MTVNTPAVALLVDVALDPSRPISEWQHHDGRTVTPAEAALIAAATWDDLEAARDLLVLDVQLEAGA